MDKPGGHRTPADPKVWRAIVTGRSNWPKPWCSLEHFIEILLEYDYWELNWKKENEA